MQNCFVPKVNLFKSHGYMASLTICITCIKSYLNANSKTASTSTYDNAKDLNDYSIHFLCIHYIPNQHLSTEVKKKRIESKCIFQYPLHSKFQIADE